MVKNEKELVLSLNKDDFVWKYSRASGNGGQKVNKTNSKVECYHPPSGVRATSQETRSQHQNRYLAFRKVVDSPVFRAWLAAKTAGMKTEREIEQEVDQSLSNPNNIKLEVRDGKGWKETTEKELT